METTDMEWDICYVIITSLTFAFLLTIAVLGLGNIATIRFTWHQKKHKRPFNLFVCAMAVGDLICSLFVTFLETLDLIEMIKSKGVGQTKNGLVWCIMKVASRIGSLTFYCTIITLIALMRLLYCIDILPRERTRLRRIMTTSIAMAAIFSLFFGLLPTWPGTMAMSVCMMQPMDNGFGVLPAIKFCYVIMCFIAILISYIVLAVNVHYRQIESSFGKKDILTLKTLAIVSIVFIVSFMLPYVCLLVPTPTNAKAVRIQFTFFRNFFYVQSFLNPIIFYVNNQAYREYVNKMVSYSKPSVTPMVNIEEPATGTRRVDEGNPGLQMNVQSGSSNRSQPLVVKTKVKIQIFNAAAHTKSETTKEEQC